MGLTVTSGPPGARFRIGMPTWPQKDDHGPITATSCFACASRVDQRLQVEARQGQEGNTFRAADPLLADDLVEMAGGAGLRARLWEVLGGRGRGDHAHLAEDPAVVGQAQRRVEVLRQDTGDERRAPWQITDDDVLVACVRTIPHRAQVISRRCRRAIKKAFS